jgi:ribosomal protein S18 acetylase RimI-like enzyme
MTGPAHDERMDRTRLRERDAHGPRLAVQADIPEMRDALVQAFLEDPVVAWVYPDTATRAKYLPEWYEIMLAAGLRCGHTYTVSSRQAVAVWSPPAVPHMVEWDRGGVEIADMMSRHLAGRTKYVLDGLMKIETAHPHDVPHFYLAMLGTLPAAQGKGMAGALLDDVLERCDREGWPSYLETSREQNVHFYERRGFRVTSEIQLPDDGPPIWFMWRESRPPEG